MMWCQIERSSSPGWMDWNGGKKKIRSWHLIDSDLSQMWCRFWMMKTKPAALLDNNWWKKYNKMESAVGLCGLLPNCFYELSWLQKWFGDKTQLSCIYHVNVHDEHSLVLILRTSCCRLIHPVKMYINWYMMWYLKKDMFCKEHDLFGWFVIF